MTIAFLYISVILSIVVEVATNDTNDIIGYIIFLYHSFYESADLYRIYPLTNALVSLFLHLNNSTSNLVAECAQPEKHNIIFCEE